MSAPIQAAPTCSSNWEPATREPLPASLASLVLDKLEAAAIEFEQAVTLQNFCDRAAIEFRRVTGFDRVLVYQFLDDDAGRVLAEARRDDQRSFSNHHFPAADIPKQARALYVRNLTRVIPDVTYQPALLRPGWSAPEPLDMSDSSLRSVSPIHVQYLKNMGVSASASVSIVKDGVLWGLIACHNGTPRMMGFDVRVTCRALAGAMARQIKAKEEAESYRQGLRLRSFEDEIVRLLSEGNSLGAALSGHLGEFSRMLGANGVAVLRAGELVMNGVCPSEAEVRDLAKWVLARTDETMFFTDRLAEAYPPAAAFRERGSGLLALTASTAEPWLLLWFRVEQVEIINWAGNPHKARGLGPGLSHQNDTLPILSRPVANVTQQRLFVPERTTWAGSDLADLAIVRKPWAWVPPRCSPRAPRSMFGKRPSTDAPAAGPRQRSKPRCVSAPRCWTRGRPGTSMSSTCS